MLHTKWLYLTKTRFYIWFDIIQRYFYSALKQISTRKYGFVHYDLINISNILASGWAVFNYILDMQNNIGYIRSMTKIQLNKIRIIFKFADLPSFFKNVLESCTLNIKCNKILDHLKLGDTLIFKLGISS